MGQDHGKFSIDTAEFEEKVSEPKPTKEERLKERDFERVGKATKHSHAFEDIGSFSMGWPFAAFAET
jgi:alanyl-tRNA synthetase